ALRWMPACELRLQQRLCPPRRGSWHILPAFRSRAENPEILHLVISVMRFKPSLEAAPLGPPITQPTASSVRRIRACSEPLRVVGTGEMLTLRVPTIGKGSLRSTSRARLLGARVLLRTQAINGCPPVDSAM